MHVLCSCSHCSLLTLAYASTATNKATLQVTLGLELTMATRSRAASSASESDYDMVLHPGVRSDAASASSEQLSAAQGKDAKLWMPCLLGQ